MPNQYALPRQDPMTPGAPRVSRVSRDLHAMLDTPGSANWWRKRPRNTRVWCRMKPAKQTLRDVIKNSNFLTRGAIMSGLAPFIAKKGLTEAQVIQAVKEAPPPPEKAAEAPCACCGPDTRRRAGSACSPRCGPAGSRRSASGPRHAAGCPAIRTSAGCGSAPP